jgi:hypothetical protein
MLLRRLWLVCAAVVAVAAIGCGRQVTPNPPGIGAGGTNEGFMSVKFDVAAPFDFTDYQYFIVFNTSGNGQTPLTNPLQTNWSAYSDAIEIGGIGGSTFAYPIQFLKNSNPTIPPTFLHVITTPQQFQLIPDSNGSGTEFEVIFQRSIFTPINGPSPSPSPSGSPHPYARTWYFNAFVTQANSQNQLIFVDSMGQGGPTDTTYSDSPPLAICTNFDTVYTKVQDITPPSNPAAQITSIEFANNGLYSPPPACPP